MTQSLSYVPLSDALTIAHVNAGRLALLAAFDSNENVVIELDPAANVDVAGVQLVESARLYAGIHGKGLTLAAPAQGRLLEVLQACGILPGSAETRTFWLCEGADL